MTTIRFLKFTQMIETLQKSVKKIKLDYAPKYGCKGIHLFWLSELLNHPNGLTPVMLAKQANIDRSLVSREISFLLKEEYIEFVGNSDKRTYNAPIILTEKGRKIAEEINADAFRIQSQADDGVGEEELEQFYKTADKLMKNLNKISNSND